MANIKDMKIGDEVKIKTLSQIMEMTDHQFKFFMKDLSHFRNVMQNADHVNKIVEKATGIPNCIQKNPSIMNWVYDDKGVCEITLESLNKDGAKCDELQLLKIKTKDNKGDL